MSSAKENQNTEDTKGNVPTSKRQTNGDLRETKINANDQPDNDGDSHSQSSPTKKSDSGTPTKSKSRRRKDARKNNSSPKKQTSEPSETQSNQQQQKKPNIPQESPANQSKTDSDSHSGAHNELSSQQQQLKLDQQTTDTEATGCNSTSKSHNDFNSWRRRLNEINKEKNKEIKELKEQLKFRDSQVQAITERVKLQMIKLRELEASLLSTTKTCHQFEKLSQQELSARTRLETENDGLNQAVARLKAQVNIHEKNKFANDELVRVLNATLMERETEVSILKLKMTRIQTNPSSTLGLNSASSVSSVKHDPCQAYATSGRSNSEFCRSSYIRSSMMAEAASTRGSVTQLKVADRDASVWAQVPAELTPSRRPLVLEKSLQPIYGESPYGIYGSNSQNIDKNPSTPISRDDRRYKTLPKSMRSPTGELPETIIIQDNTYVQPTEVDPLNQPSYCRVTNLDDSNSTSQSSGNRTLNSPRNNETSPQLPSTGVVLQPYNPEDSKSATGSLSRADPTSSKNEVTKKEENSTQAESSHYSTISNTNLEATPNKSIETDHSPPRLPIRTPTSPAKFSNGLKRIFGKFKRSDSSTNSQSRTDLRDVPTTPTTSPFKRGANRSTLGPAMEHRINLSPRRQMNFLSEKPFAEWDTDMLVDWLTMIGLSMYSTNCRRWVRCGAHIMNATPAEVDKGLGITNHLHRKKLRLAISELNGDCDKITKAAAKLDYLWVARWLDDIGLPQYKEAFINARVDGRVLNYLTVEDLVSLGVKSLLHHASIRCGIRVLRSINFDLQLLKRRATAEEVEQMSSVRQRMNQVTNSLDNQVSKPAPETSISVETDVPLWTCHRVMEWLRMIDFAEFAPNLRGSGMHGGLIVFEDGFNIETMCSLLSIPNSRTLLRRHLSTFFESLVGPELIQRKHQFRQIPSNQHLNPSAEIKTPKKTQLWFTKLKSSKVGQDGMDEYLCPMYPVEPQIIKSPTRKSEGIISRDGPQLGKIPESVDI